MMELRLAVIGDPIAHTLSPLIQGRMMERLGVKGEYRAHHVRAGEVEERVDERRAVPARKDEAVAVGPGNVFGVEVEEFEPEGRRNVRQAERHAGVTALRLLHHVRREAADRVGREFQLIVRQLHELSFRDGWWGRFAAEWKKRDGRRTAFKMCHYTTNQGACRF